MRKQLLMLLSILFIGAYTTHAQEEKTEKKEKIVIEVQGSSIIVNGKPIKQFKDDNLEIVVGDSLVYNFLNGNSAMVKYYNKALLGVYTKTNKDGAEITEVSKQSAAEKAGLKVNDIIIKVNDEKVTEENDLTKIIRKFNAGDKMMITYIRDGKEATTQATLDKNKTTYSKEWNRYFENGFADTNGRYFFNTYPHKPKLGIQIQDIEEGNGVKVLDVDDDTPAEKAGLKEDDIIIEINGSAVKNVDDLREKIRDIKEGDIVKIKYKRGNKQYNTEIKFPKKLKKATL
jgi:serine protease Do